MEILWTIEKVKSNVHYWNVFNVQCNQQNQNKKWIVRRENNTCPNQT